MTQLFTTLRTHPLSGLIACIALVFLAYAHSLVFLVNFWLNSEEYSHGLIIPFVIAYILWTNRAEYIALPVGFNGVGVLGIVASQLLHFAAILADIESVKLYSMLLCIASVIYTFGSRALLLKMAFILLLFFFSIPLPHILNTLMTAKMQLVSSNMGVWFIRLIGLPVLQTGNIIDMGSFKMLVAEACSGLRYMYPLISIGFIVAYFYRAPWWAKLLIVVITVPITIFMNSFRIAITGLIIKEFGSEAAEGFLHDFEGWVVFMAAFMLLILFVQALTFALPGGLSFRQRLDFSESIPQASVNSHASINALDSKTVAVMAFLFLSVITSNVLSFSHTQVVPQRESFANFPFAIDSYELFPGKLSAEVLDVLKSDDHFIGDYHSRDKPPINLYMVYYQSQRDGSALHSPKECIPGGGWEIKSINTEYMPQLPGKVNRAIIAKDDQQLLVYYWIHQQGQNYANEFKARASLLWTSIKDNRSDGALIRIVVPIGSGGIPAAEKAGREFVASVSAKLGPYLPE